MSYRGRRSKGKPTTREVYAEMTAVERVIFVVAALNFTAFLLGFMLLGGGAESGFIRAGHYFLGSHGKYTEVSAAVYRYSQLHTVAFFITSALGALASVSARQRLR